MMKTIKIRAERGDKTVRRRVLQLRAQGVVVMTHLESHDSQVVSIELEDGAAPSAKIRELIDQLQQHTPERGAL